MAVTWQYTVFLCVLVVLVVIELTMINIPVFLCSSDNVAVAPDVTLQADTTTVSPEEGVDPSYLEILKESERRSARDFRSSHNRGEQGVVIGPTEGKFERHTLRALRNARRIRNILAGDRSIKVALMTSPEHIETLNKCGTKPKKEHEEACRLWANNTLFDDVVATKDGEYKWNDNHTNVGQGSSKYWLKALGGYRNAPYTITLFLDSDAYPCPGFQNLLLMAKPKNGREMVGSRLWQLPTTAAVDFAAGIDQFPYGTGNKNFWTPGNQNILDDFQFFPERNTGTVLFSFHRELAHTFAHFIPLVSEHIYNIVATPEMRVVNDQCPFRVALYLFRRLRPDFNDQQLPMHSSCRTYPGKKYAGTDGFLNGMFPIQQDGKHCSECLCTPCLIAHASTHPVYINGRNGWEDDRYFNST